MTIQYNSCWNGEVESEFNTLKTYPLQIIIHKQFPFQNFADGRFGKIRSSSHRQMIDVFIGILFVCKMMKKIVRVSNFRWENNEKSKDGDVMDGIFNIIICQFQNFKIIIVKFNKMLGYWVHTRKERRSDNDEELIFLII